MIYILIIFMSGYGGSIDHIEFQHKESCEAAVNALRLQPNADYLRMVCIKKNIKAAE